MTDTNARRSVTEPTFGQSASTGGLEPCPFCGNSDRVHVIAYHACDYVDKSEGLEGFIVLCDASGFGRKSGCGAATGWYETVAAASAAWNRRSNVQSDRLAEDKGEERK